MQFIARSFSALIVSATLSFGSAVAAEFDVFDYEVQARDADRFAELSRELRAVYLAYHGLLPEYPLPLIHLVFGAGNSGGTATADAQVLGLEVACRSGIGPNEYRRYMRTMFAHETARSWQPQVDDSGMPDLLLFAALREAFARPRVRAPWAQFMRDRQTLLAR